MIQAYIEHFQTGDIELHKESQRIWVKDIGPIV
jgi:dipeptidyl-peptidase-3